MKENEMHCGTCFYNVLLKTKVTRNEVTYAVEVGVEVECRADPAPQYRTLNSPYRCGRGRWWENGKWIKWIDKED